MVLSIKSKEADLLARQLMKETGESITAAVTKALRDRLERLHAVNAIESKIASLQAISKYYQSLPTTDERSPEEIIGYDKQGLL
ncbi:MAG: type II toxin-antitoxin system VapB family antitoxin [Deltaproteobacteria bacterium]|nr:type II toxin-antitoxin system VapB family antitoxin [Deltaproteobacteria bacterium]